MDKLDHCLDGGPKMDEVFHLLSADVRKHVNVKNAVDFTKELLRTETSPPKIEGRSEKAKRKSASLQPKPMPKKKIFSMETNALFAQWLRSAAHKSISANSQKSKLRADKGVDTYEEVIASADDAQKVKGISPKIALQWNEWFQDWALHPMTPSQSF